MWRGEGRLGSGERTRSLGPKRNSSTTGTTGDHVSEQARVSGSPCGHWPRGPWVWTWSACLPPCHPWTWSGTLRTQRKEWLPERLSPSASPSPLTCFCGSFLPNRSKGERRIERERERERPKPTMLALKWQIFMQKKVISSLEGRTFTDIKI